MNQDVPGPGHYPPPDNVFNKTATKFGTSTRDELYKSHLAPGPGKYHNDEVDNTSYRFFAPTHKFGKSTRTDFNESRYAPGPGKYDIGGESFSKVKKGYTILPKREGSNKKSSDDTPGPGTYKQ